MAAAEGRLSRWEEIAAVQLTLEGDERWVGPHAALARVRLSPPQREIMRLVGARGSVRPVEAGTIVHRHRELGCRLRGLGSYEGQGCCHYAASDGWDALKRLRRRGLVRDVGDGTWVAA